MVLVEGVSTTEEVDQRRKVVMPPLSEFRFEMPVDGSLEITVSHFFYVRWKAVQRKSLDVSYLYPSLTHFLVLQSHVYLPIPGALS